MESRPRPRIEQYALTLAEAAATRSEDPKRQVGAAVIGHRGEVLALGYNGPPSGVEIDDWSHRGMVRLLTVHAEANALRYVRPGEADFMASTYMPCVECVKAARAQGVTLIVFREWMSADRIPGADVTRDVARRLGVVLEHHPRENE